MKKTVKLHYSYLVLISCCLIVGIPSAMTINCVGVFLTSISKDIGVGLGALSIYSTILFITMAVFLPFAGKMMAKFDVRILATTAVILAAGSMALMSTFHNVYQFYFTGFTLGIANTFTLYLIGPTLINRWFKSRPGFYLGMVMAFTGVGAVSFSTLGGFLIGLYGWRTTYLIFSAITAIVVLPCSAIILRSYPEDKGLKPIGVEARGTVEAAVESGVSASHAIKTTSFLMICIFTAAIAFATAGINQYLAAFTDSIGFSSVVGGVIISVANAGNMCGKTLLGALNDKNVYAAMSIACICGITGILIMLFLSSTGLWVTLVGAALFGICLSAPVVQSAMLVRTVFGNREYSQIYAYAMTLASLGSGFGASIFGFINDITGDYSAMFLVGIILIVVAFFSGLVSLRKGEALIHATS